MVQTLNACGVEERGGWLGRVSGASVKRQKDGPWLVKDGKQKSRRPSPDTPSGHGEKHLSQNRGQVEEW